MQTLAQSFIFWKTPCSGKRQLRDHARASVWQTMLALISPPCCARVYLGPGFPHKAAPAVFGFASAVQYEPARNENENEFTNQGTLVAMPFYSCKLDLMGHRWPEFRAI
jgi:hypothetical protein